MLSSLNHRLWFLRPLAPHHPSDCVHSRWIVMCSMTWKDHPVKSQSETRCHVYIYIYKVKKTMRIKIITSTIDLHIIALTITCNPTTKATNTTPEAILGHICRCQVAGCPMTNSTTNNLSQADTQQLYLVNLVGGWKILVNLGHLFSGRGENTKEARNNHLVT